MNEISKDHIEKITPEQIMGKLNDVEIKYAPKTLYFKGNIHIMDNAPRVSIIGTRNPSENGINNAKILTKFLVDNGIVIVSGLAKGIDTIAHKTAILNRGKTIAVVGTPLDRCYPAENYQLQKEIISNHLLISQFPIGSRVYPGNFPLRNRTMALLSNASIIIEAGKKSGTEHQGWEALRLGRPLFIVEDFLKDNDFEWVEKLINYGAKLISLNTKELILEDLPIPVLEAVNVTF